MSYHSYHIEGGDACFKELPSRILMREDGYLSAYRLDGEPIADYWYVPESECLKLRTENAKLRELVTAQCECVKHDDCSECVHYSEDKCTFPFKVMHRELRVEVG